MITCLLSRDVIGYEGYKCDDSHKKCQLLSTIALLFKTTSTRTIRSLSNWLIDALHLLQLSLRWTWLVGH